MSLPDPSPLKPQDAVMYALGELKGQMGAVIQSQASQGEVNAEFRRELGLHDAALSTHDAALAVLNDSRLAAKATRTDAFNRVMIWVTALGVAGSLILGIFNLNHP